MSDAPDRIGGDANDLTVRSADGPSIVSDTASISSYAKGKLDGADSTVEFVGEYKRSFYAGPLPDAQTLAELAALYPEAPKIIFDDFVAQAKHRRSLEGKVVDTNNRLALRGQLIAGGLGAVGLLVSGGVAAMGQPLGGFGIAVASLTALVSVFLAGREKEKKERVEKAKVQAKIAKNEPLESTEPEGQSPDTKA
jgi:Predicted membrane protein (DUF2335)